LSESRKANRDSDAPGCMRLGPETHRCTSSQTSSDRERNHVSSNDTAKAVPAGSHRRQNDKGMPVQNEPHYQDLNNQLKRQHQQLSDRERPLTYRHTPSQTSIDRERNQVSSNGYTTGSTSTGTAKAVPAGSHRRDLYRTNFSRHSGSGSGNLNGNHVGRLGNTQPNLEDYRLEDY
jgi:hypothetical protein